MSRITNRELVEQIRKRKTFRVEGYVENWVELFKPSKRSNGYIVVIATPGYCKVCGHKVGSCACNPKEDDAYTFFLNSDVWTWLKKMRNKGAHVTLLN